MHVIGQLSLNANGTLSAQARARLKRFWRHRQYLIIDEYSMLSKTFLANLSNNISIGMQDSPHFKPDDPFGGLNVILCGDLHQFPPVANWATEALYHPVNGADDSTEAQIGRKIYESFTTVVILKEQMRVTDPTWREFLTRLRYGRVGDSDIRMLQNLIIDQGDSPLIDFDAEPWCNAGLVTPRHAVREKWNEFAVRKWCRTSREQLFVCTARDEIRGRELSRKEKYVMASRHGENKRKKCKDLPWKIEIAKGMKVMVTNNLKTDLDVTNGARGEIVDIVLHPDEPLLPDGPIVNLKHPPAYVLVKLERTKASPLPGLETGVIPIEPIASKMKIIVNGSARTVTRHQLPMTAAYAFTDYRAQGQSIPYVIVDIAKPPSCGNLTLFSVYVALSRSSGRHTIRLLRDFDEETFKRSHHNALLAEDNRLEELNERTKKEWEAYKTIVEGYRTT